MTNRVYRNNSRENRGEATASSLSAAEVITTVRRLGYIALKMHEVIMSRLGEGDAGTAERFNDMFKPLAEMLIRFDLEDRDGV